MGSWYALYSQTGSEIHEICLATGLKPFLVLTDNRSDPISRRGNYTSVVCGSREVLEQRLLDWAASGDLITMHGYKRIVSPATVRALKARGVKFLNGHPGAIDLYPELRGLDPQKRAIEAGYSTVGCVIHEVEPELDSGKILASEHIQVRPYGAEVYEQLHYLMTQMWIKLFKEKLMKEL